MLLDFNDKFGFFLCLDAERVVNAGQISRSKFSVNDNASHPGYPSRPHWRPLSPGIKNDLSVWLRPFALALFRQAILPLNDGYVKHESG